MIDELVAQLKVMADVAINTADQCWQGEDDEAAMWHKSRAVALNDAMALAKAIYAELNESR